MIDAQNGTMLVPDYQANVGVFLAHCEDFETLEAGFTRHQANFEDFAEKAKKLTSAQVFFLQQEIALFWESAHKTNLVDFINKIK